MVQASDKLVPEKLAHVNLIPYRVWKVTAVNKAHSAKAKASPVPEELKDTTELLAPRVKQVGDWVYLNWTQVSSTHLKTLGKDGFPGAMGTRG